MNCQTYFLGEKTRKNISKCRLLKILPKLLLLVCQPILPKMLSINKRNKEANNVMESVILFSLALCASIVVHTCTNIIKTSYLTHYKNKSLAVLSTCTDVISIHPNQPKIFAD